MSKETNYTLEYLENNIMVWNNSKVVAQGFTDNESALHAVWVMEGKNLDNFYKVNDGCVTLHEKLNETTKGD